MLNVNEEKLDDAVRQIQSKIPELNKFTSDEIKDFIRIRANELITCLQ